MTRAASDLDQLFGFRYPQIRPDRVEIEWDVRPELHAPFETLHGGVHCCAIESAATVGAAAWLGERGSVAVVSTSADFLRTVRSGTLRAVATPIHRGRSQQLWLVEVHDGGGRLASRGQVRLSNVT